MIRNGFVLAALLAGAWAGSASADVVISANPTLNMSCSGGVCAPTATDAVLNVTDLENLLAAGSVSVVTTNGSIQANNIDITGAFSYAGSSNLTLDAYQSITFSAYVRNRSTGNVSLITDDGGSGGALTFRFGPGKLTFAQTSNVLIINGQQYQLAASVKQLAEEIVRDPHHNYALSNDYDASPDGVYYTSPIAIPFYGSFSGLGHNISHLEIADTDYEGALFEDVAKGSSVSGITLKDAIISYGAAALAGINDGTISNASVERGSMQNTSGSLVGTNNGTILTSRSSARVSGEGAGGLVADNSGNINLSFATGGVRTTVFSGAGGLAGQNYGTIENSYASGKISGRPSSNIAGFLSDGEGGTVSNSYAIGAVSSQRFAVVGGFACVDNGTTFSDTYWDTTTSGTDQGACNGNETGITGLTTQELQSGLPSGFDPSIWAEDSSINNGFPYLIDNPPPQ